MKSFGDISGQLTEVFRSCLADLSAQENGVFGLGVLVAPSGEATDLCLLTLDDIQGCVVGGGDLDEYLSNPFDWESYVSASYNNRLCPLFKAAWEACDMEFDDKVRRVGGMLCHSLVDAVSSLDMESFYVSVASYEGEGPWSEVEEMCELLWPVRRQRLLNLLQIPR